MKVKELMTTAVATTPPNANLARAARLMWDRDCGVLPVVDATGHVMGMITDRDICRAVTTHARPASRIAVEEIASHHVYSVTPEDDAETALQAMTAHQVRRLPVVDAGGHLKGILSMNDIVLHAGDATGVKASAIVDALKGICAHKHLELA
jgi:CBS domain-containing protein